MTLRFRLRTWLLVCLAGGPLLGWGGPPLVKWLSAWHPPSSPRVPPPRTAPFQESAGERPPYFESAESPLY